MAKAPAKRTRKAPAFRLNDIMAEASWAEADAALAAVLQEFATLESAARAATRVLKRAGAEARVDALDSAVLMVRQHLQQAARRRGLRLFGQVGDVVAFDAARHELARPAKQSSKQVKIVVSGVMRGERADAKVLAKARVSPVRARRGS